MKKGILEIEEEEEVDSGLVNLTPLIDVVFVVLILFILIAPLLHLDRVELAPSSLGQKEEVSSIQENRGIKIYVLSDNSILFNGASVTEKELLQLLKEAKVKYPHAIPLLFQDRSSYFGTYQSVKNIVETAGFAEMDLILKPHF